MLCVNYYDFMLMFEWDIHTNVYAGIHRYIINLFVFDTYVHTYTQTHISFICLFLQVLSMLNVFACFVISENSLLIFSLISVVE